MCTALSLKNKTKILFGRNMDIEAPFGQQIVIVPRNHVWPMRFQKSFKQTYAMIGMAFPFKDGENNQVVYPLYAEAANEKGLAISALNFPGTAYYPEPGTIAGAFEITPYEFIPWILANFTTTDEVEEFLKNNNVRIVNKPIASFLPCAPQHYIVADKNNKSIVVEPCKDGLKVHENELGILTNNPTFDWHMLNLSFYQNLGAKQLTEVDWAGLKIKPHGQGFASHGIPGDWTPASRFVRTAFLKSITSEELSDIDLINQFFHILDNVAMVKGSIIVENQSGIHDDITLYSCCIDLNNLVYYYKTYENNQLNAIELANEDLNSDKVVVYPFNQTQSIKYVNRK